MPRFAYEARDSTGATDSGVLTAANLMEASRALRKDGKVVLNLAEATGAGGLQRFQAANKRIKRDDVIYFTVQLAVMVDTGVPLAEALDVIGEQTDHPGMQRVLRDISERVQGGVEFSTALEQHPKIFPKLFVAMMQASEISGTMGEMLQRVSEYMERERETRKRVKGALTYPVCMLSFCTLVVIALLVFVLPRFAKIYAGKGAALPMPTRALMGLSDAIVNYWPFIIGGAVALAVGIYLYVRSPAGKIFMDAVRIRVPILGPMYRKACLARSLRTMATMVSSGVSMLDGLLITAQVAGNHSYARIWHDVAERIKEGSTVADPLYGTKLVPTTIAQMVSAGERTGKLGMVLNRVAGFCEDELSVSIKTVTSMIEPAMIIIMGLIVGGIAMALLLPVFSISKVVAR